MPEKEKMTATASQPLGNGEDEGANKSLWMTKFRRLAWILAAGVMYTAGSHIWIYAQRGTRQSLAYAVSLLLSTVVLIPAYLLGRRGRHTAAGNWIVLGLAFDYIGSDLFFEGLFWFDIVGGSLLILLVSSVVLPRKWGNWVISIALFGVCVWLVDWLEPLARFNVVQLPILRINSMVISILLTLAVFWQIGRAFRFGTIRTRLIVAFAVLTLLPAVIIGSVSALVGFRSEQRRVGNHLDLAITFKAVEINAWLDDLQSGLNRALDEQDAIQFARVILQERPTIKADFRGDLEERLLEYIERTQQFEKLFLLDSQGQVSASTDYLQRGKIYKDRAYFREGLQGPHLSLYSTPSGQNVVTAQPVLDRQGQTVGVLVGYTSLKPLEKIVRRRVKLGETGRLYLVGLDHNLLTEPYWEAVHTTGVETALIEQNDGAALYQGYEGQLVMGAYHWLSRIQVALMAEQDQAEAFSSVYSLTRINVGVALTAALFAIIISLFIARSIGNPLAELAETTTLISAGDLDRIAVTEREDEIGVLAASFNSMTLQLRELIADLERRVADRTRELEQRSTYLEASTEVGRAATSILDADQLIQQVVELIRERFELYYVGLFLVDEASESAVLQAGTGGAGKVMLARGHQIAIGEGMIGWSIAREKARIALDVGDDAVRLATPELPDTRSEAALPLRSRGNVIGALTVQSDQPAAFDEAIIAVLQIMADQVAVALDNARLFSESRRALQAARSAYGELSRDAWHRLLRVQTDLAYCSDERGVTSAEKVWRPEMEQALRDGVSIEVNGSDAEDRQRLAIPIKARGEVIGVLDTYKPGDTEAWTEDEIILLEALTDQLGLALESARLYRDTQRRAAREQLTGEIMARIRETLEVDTVLQTAVREIGDSLGLHDVTIRLNEDGDAGRGEGVGHA